MKPEPARLWAGSRERIFTVLPGTVLANFNNPRSENALLWNIIYPRAQPYLSLHSLLRLKHFWGSSSPDDVKDDQLIPYYWGYRQNGSRLHALDDVLNELDGSGPKTEIDLFLLGQRNIILVEAKHTSVFGRCMRYSSRRCPEIHPAQADESVCRYWEPGPANFADALAFGSRPDYDAEEIPCYTHYQLARTFVIGKTLAEQLSRQFALWVFLPQKHWRVVEKTWMDFVDRVVDDHLWRWMRVISWEQIQTLPSR